MIQYIKKLFGFGQKEKEEVSTLAFEFSIHEDENSNSRIVFDITNPFKLSHFTRNSDLKIDINGLSDQEIAYLLMHKYSQDWLSKNFNKPLYVETHTFTEDSFIKYERSWNKPFIQRVAGLDLGPLPESEDELAEMYMNYIYASRMIEEEELKANTDPISVAHPSLSSPNNQIKS